MDFMEQILVKTLHDIRSGLIEFVLFSCRPIRETLMLK